MKKKYGMFNTFKTAVFGKVTAKDGTKAPAVRIIDNRLVINGDYCDLRTVKERYNPDSKTLTVSAVDNMIRSNLTAVPVNDGFSALLNL